MSWKGTSLKEMLYTKLQIDLLGKWVAKKIIFR